MLKAINSNEASYKNVLSMLTSLFFYKKNRSKVKSSQNQPEIISICMFEPLAYIRNPGEIIFLDDLIGFDKIR